LRGEGPFNRSLRKGNHSGGHVNKAAGQKKQIPGGDAIRRNGLN